VADDEPKPRTVDRTGQAERDWVDGETERRHGRWTKRKQSIDSARRMLRAGMTSLELHRSAVERAMTISTVSSPPVGRSSPNSERERPGPPAQQPLHPDPRYQEGWFVIRRRLEDVHRLLDEAEGLGATAVSTMLAEEKNRLILVDGRGHSCEAVVDLLGREVAGSSRTVWRIRRNQAVVVLGYAVSTVDGERLPERDDPGVRRVRID
jgi:hypothetical protein